MVTYSCYSLAHGTCTESKGRRTVIRSLRKRKLPWAKGVSYTWQSAYLLLMNRLDSRGIILKHINHGFYQTCPIRSTTNHKSTTARTLLHLDHDAAWFFKIILFIRIIPCFSPMKSPRYRVIYCVGMTLARHTGQVTNDVYRHFFFFGYCSYGWSLIITFASKLSKSWIWLH